MFNYTDGQTPLEEDEKEGLLIPVIATRNELDEFEQLNIEQAVQWTLGRSFRADTVFTETFIKTVHKRMFADVWAWAGAYRNSDKNIGVDKWQIPTQLKCLLDDTRFWYENDTCAPDEIALRFKHRLVSIHCFPNGNGRHSRLMADIIMGNMYKRPVFTWGAVQGLSVNETRAAYLQSLKAADRGEYDLLIRFARS